MSILFNLAPYGFLLCHLYIIQANKVSFIIFAFMFPSSKEDHINIQYFVLNGKIFSISDAFWEKECLFKSISTTCYYKENIATAFYGWGSTISRLQSHYEKAAHFLPLISQKFLVLIWSTSERWRAESSLEPPSSFEPGTPGLGIQCPNHWDNAP